MSIPTRAAAVSTGGGFFYTADYDGEIVGGALTKYFIYQYFIYRYFIYRYLVIQRAGLVQFPDLLIYSLCRFPVCSLVAKQARYQGIRSKTGPTGHVLRIFRLCSDLRCANLALVFDSCCIIYEKVLINQYYTGFSYC